MRNLWSKTLLPKCMIQLYFPAPWFMTTFGLLLTPDRHFFFSWSLQDQDLNEVQVLFYPVGCQKHLLGGSASSHPGVLVFFHHCQTFPSTAPLWLCLEQFRDQSDLRCSGNLASESKKDSPIYLGAHESLRSKHYLCVWLVKQCLPAPA